ncbi:hypothetical protein SAMN02745664_11510 [Moraxella cuniculi DSM 21768]|uniref:Uncharacterized protein n=2 Tax=Moraxella cuniculi TaxID=34061 RepID=A0A1N7FNH5_9GAMM|nr:hypothetical protein [Moraxella cuniculi]OOS04721.1 hypothetical protein B0189_07950 [Moraxella cuniculi]SIS01871.1 hypothetical protein SAMN02745664_11510 [Moraxella cuniculi DSM 21768]VEG13969.1 Uncharacterised protein [Moraxella cuniculi]
MKQHHYPLIEGLGDWLCAYLISGSIVLLTGGGTLLLFAVALFIIILLSFALNFTLFKFACYILALIFCLVATLAILPIQQELTATWLVIGFMLMTHIFLTYRYYKIKIYKK